MPRRIFSLYRFRCHLRCLCSALLLGNLTFVKLTAIFYQEFSSKELSEAMSTTSTLPWSKTSKGTSQMLFLKFTLQAGRGCRTFIISAVACFSARQFHINENIPDRQEELQLQNTILPLKEAVLVLASWMSAYMIRILRLMCIYLAGEAKKRKKKNWKLKYLKKLYVCVCVSVFKQQKPL